MFNQGKRKDFSRKIREVLSSLLFFFQSNHFLLTQSQIELSVAIAKEYPSIYHSVPCSHYEAQSMFNEARTLNMDP